MGGKSSLSPIGTPVSASQRTLGAQIERHHPAQRRQVRSKRAKYRTRLAHEHARPSVKVQNRVHALEAQDDVRTRGDRAPDEARVATLWYYAHSRVAAVPNDFCNLRT